MTTSDGKKCSGPINETTTTTTMANVTNSVPKNDTNEKKGLLREEMKKGAEKNLNEPDSKRVVKQRQGETNVVVVVVVVVVVNAFFWC